MNRKISLLAGGVVGILLLSCGQAGSANAETYGDYSGMFDRTAGQFLTGSSVTGQWAWSPQSATESHITWGHPSDWPKGQKERFIREGDYVLLDGWWGNGTYYKQDVTQWRADSDCKSNREQLPSGAQRYVAWQAPAEGSGYCLFAAGTLTEQSSGKTVRFAHQQVWSAVNCPSNPHRNATECLKQTETWWDDNHKPWSESLHRDVYLAKGHGMAYRVDNRNVKNHSSITSTHYLKYRWNW